MMVGKVIDNMSRGCYIPIGLVRSRNDYSNFVHEIEVGAYVNLDKTNLAYLVS